MLRQIARGAPGTLWRRILSPANPAAGAGVTVAVPQHRAWQLCSVSATLTASAVAGNRLPALDLIDPSGTTLVKIASPTAITATLAPRVTWVPGVGAATVVAASYAVLTLPDRWYMQPGESLTITGGTDPDDQWSAVRLVFLETNTGDPAYGLSVEQQIRDHWEAIHSLTTDTGY